MNLDQIVVREFMTTNVVTLREHQSLRLASGRVFSQGLDEIAVVDGSGQFLGLVSQRDLAAAERSHILARTSKGEPKKAAVLLDTLISRDVETVSPSSSLREVLSLVLAENCTLIPVVEDVEFVGVVTMRGLLTLAV